MFVYVARKFARWQLVGRGLMALNYAYACELSASSEREWCRYFSSTIYHRQNNVFTKIRKKSTLDNITDLNRDGENSNKGWKNALTLFTAQL